ncbi:MAG: hypothetical protein HYU29_07540 [Chloroflexi bacterium]|nr:hypothetical protein [Chloroflexota bacterium]
MTTSHPAAELLETLFKTAPHHLYLEIRPIPNGFLSRDRRFFRLRQLQRHGFDQAIPAELGGRSNVYFGVCLRRQRGGTASDAAIAICLWADLDQGLPTPWPTEVPEPSIVVETSPGKAQAYWLLSHAAEHLDKVEELDRRLVHVLGGDMAATNRARVLRLPGFRNLKYPEQPIARLVEMHPEQHYTLEAFASLPPLAKARLPQGSTGSSAHPRRFDPHAGGAGVPQ